MRLMLATTLRLFSLKLQPTNLFFCILFGQIFHHEDDNESKDWGQKERKKEKTKTASTAASSKTCYTQCQKPPNEKYKKNFHEPKLR